MSELSLYEQMGGTYHEDKNGCLIPDIQLGEHEAGQKPIGYWGRIRRAFLKESNPMLYSDMILTGTLFPHLREVDVIAEARMDTMMEQLLERFPAPDKKADALAWVRHMGSLREQAREITLTEIIYE